MMQNARNETPAAAAVPSAPMMFSRSAAKTIKEARKMEFPIIPAGKGKATTLAKNVDAYGKMEGRKDVSPVKDAKKAKRSKKVMG